MDLFQNLPQENKGGNTQNAQPENNAQTNNENNAISKNIEQVPANNGQPATAGGNNQTTNNQTTINPPNNNPTSNNQTGSNPALNNQATNNQVINSQTVNNQTITNQPVVNQPVVNQPAVNQPVVNQPVVNQPAVNQPAVNQPAVNQPAVNQPAVNQPAVNQVSGNQITNNQKVAELSTGKGTTTTGRENQTAPAVVTPKPAASEVVAKPAATREPKYNYWAEFTKGIIRENPIFVILLGLCPTLSVSTQVINALGMGAAFLFVLLCSNIFISLLKDFIPDKVRIPAYIVIIASFVTMVDLAMQAWAPALSKSLGVFVQLIVVNCIILGRAEAFASKRSVGKSILDALGMGIGFTLSLLLISVIREVLSAGKITLIPVEALGFDGTIEVPGLVSLPARIMSFAAGALFVMGLLLALFNWIGEKRKAARKARLENQS